MKKLVFAVIVLFVIASCKNNKKGTAISTPVPVVDTLLVTDTSWGLINKDLNFSDLQVIYGSNNIKDERICGAECIDSIDVTKLYPGTKNEAVIYWKDGAYHKIISTIRCYTDSATYHTSAGIKIGSSITDLLKLNGRKINFYGFGWDYGGSIISYNNGKLEKSPVNFDLDVKSEVDNNLYGDIELNTNLPLVKAVSDKITVRSISLSFIKD